MYDNRSKYSRELAIDQLKADLIKCSSVKSRI